MVQVTTVGVYYRGKLTDVFESESARVAWDCAVRLARDVAPYCSPWCWMRECDGRIAYVSGDHVCASIEMPNVIVEES